MTTTATATASRRPTLDERGRELLFTGARTHGAWLDTPVSDETLHELYDLLKWGPTSANSNPARFVFLKTKEAKARLLPCLAPGNIGKTVAAPVTVIVAYDLKFYEKLPKLFPQNPGMRDYFANSPDLAAIHAFRNGSLQGGYFILAARSLGLDCGPMSGFDNAKVDAEFFPAPTAPTEVAPDVLPSSQVKSNFLCNLGYGDPAKLPPRNPRLGFNEVCQLL